MNSNLPPGVTESMIPGNRPEDVEWERFLEDLDEEYKGDIELLKQHIIVGSQGVKGLNASGFVIMGKEIASNLVDLRDRVIYLHHNDIEANLDDIIIRLALASEQW